MTYFIIVAFSLIFISSLVGILTISLFKINLKYVTFSSPIGFLVLLALLQLGYFLIMMLNLDNFYFVYYTVLLFVLIIISSIVFYRKIIDYFKSFPNRLIKVIIALLISIIVIYIFSKVEFNFRFDDMNFYGKFIPNRITSASEYSFSYSYQAFYILISVCVYLSKFLSFLGIYTEFLPLAFVIWVPAILTVYFFAFTLSDFISFIKEKVKLNWITITLWIAVVGIIFFEYWYFTHPHFAVTLRRLPMIYLFYFIEKDVDIKKMSRNTILLSLLFGASFAISSSGFFIDMILIYCYAVFMLIKKQRRILCRVAIMSIYPIIFACSYITILQLPFILTYILIIALTVSNYDIYVEKVLQKLVYIVMLLVPVIIIYLTYINPIFSPEYIQLYIGDRAFFTPINSFDMVTDILNFNFHSSTFIFNMLFWILILVYLVLKGFKNRDYVFWILLVFFITFYNPLVFTFISTSLTSFAYYRISDIFLNIVILSIIFIDLIKISGKYKYLIVTFAGCMFALKLINFDINMLKSGADFNMIYHAKQSELDIINKLQEEYLKFEDRSSFKIASHIYGIQLLNSVNIENQLEDRFAYEKLENDEFERIFYRRQPGFEDIDVNYQHACTLAFEKETDYVILEAQYNWQLQEGLWPCSELLFEEGNYRVLKTNYDYWEWNILQGYTEKYVIGEEKR